MHFCDYRSGRFIVSGNCDGTVMVWDTTTATEESDTSEPILNPCITFDAHADCVNGVRLVYI